MRDIVDTEQVPVQTRNGINMPSFIVMDHGLPFDEWVTSITPDFALALQVCLTAYVSVRSPHLLFVSYVVCIVGWHADILVGIHRAVTFQKFGFRFSQQIPVLFCFLALREYASH